MKANWPLAAFAWCDYRPALTASAKHMRRAETWVSG